MADVKIESAVSATITLSNVPEDVFRDICAYIEKKTSGLDRAVAKSVKTVSVISDPEVPKKTRERKFEEYGNMQKDPRLQAIDRLYANWSKRPEMYTLETVTAADYILRNGALKNVPPISVGKKLARMEKMYAASLPSDRKKMIFAGYNKNGNPQMARAYCIPIQKDGYGVFIKREREKSRLTVKELSDLIGYDVSVIMKWESGEFTPSSEAIGILKKVFGNDIFDGIKA